MSNTSCSNGDHATRRGEVWSRNLRMNEYIDVEDTTHKWCEAVVIGLTKHKVHVHYRSWPSKMNEWIAFESPRLARAYTKVRNWRLLKKGDKVQLETDVNGVKDPVWRNGTVRQVRRGDSTSGVPVSVQVQLDDDGETRWVDTQDDGMCAPGTHRVPRRTQADDNEESSDEVSNDYEPEMIILSEDNESVSATKCSDDAEENKRLKKQAVQKRKRSDDDDDFATWREALAPTAELEVADKKMTQWYEARVREVYGKREILVRFRGWPWRYDECLQRSSPRLAPPATHLGRWREFKLKQPLQIGFQTNAKADGPSHWVQGKVTKLSRSSRTGQLVRVEVEWKNDQGKMEHAWRSVHDDLLAPVGLPTFLLPKRRAISAGPAVGDGEDEDANADDEGHESDMEKATLLAIKSDASSESILEILRSLSPVGLEAPEVADVQEETTPPSVSDGTAHCQLRQTILETFDRFKAEIIAMVDRGISLDERIQSVPRRRCRHAIGQTSATEE